MTAIAALEHNGKVYMGGDSFCGDVDKGTVDICDTPKVYKCGKILIGICGSIKCEQVLEKCAKEHIENNDNVTRDWIQNEFSIILMEEMVKAKTVIYKEKVPMMPDGSSFIFGVHGKIVVMGEDFSTYRSKRGYTTLGVAGYYALGSLHALINDDKYSPEEKIKKALKAATDLSMYSREPYTIISG